MSMKKIVVGAMALAVCCACGDECVFGSSGPQLRLSDEQIEELQRTIYECLCRVFAIDNAKLVVRRVSNYVKKKGTMQTPSDAEGVYKVFVAYALRGPNEFADLLVNVWRYVLWDSDIYLLLRHLDKKTCCPDYCGFLSAASSKGFIKDEVWVAIGQREPLTTLVGVGQLE